MQKHQKLREKKTRFELNNFCETLIKFRVLLTNIKVAATGIRRVVKK